MTFDTNIRPLQVSNSPFQRPVARTEYADRWKSPGLIICDLRKSAPPRRARAPPYLLAYILRSQPLLSTPVLLADGGAISTWSWFLTAEVTAFVE